MVVAVLFICAGNICRSPMAEAVFRNKVALAGLQDQFRVDSAGTGSWHAGESPHRGTQGILRQYEVPLMPHTARQLDRDDLRRFDYLVVMDSENEDDVKDLTTNTSPRGALVRLLDYADPARARGVRNVPDPYYGDRFEEVYQLVDAGCDGLLRHLRQEHQR